MAEASMAVVVRAAEVAEEAGLAVQVVVVVGLQVLADRVLRAKVMQEVLLLIQLPIHGLLLVAEVKVVKD